MNSQTLYGCRDRAIWTRWAVFEAIDLAKKLAIWNFCKYDGGGHSESDQTMLDLHVS